VALENKVKAALDIMQAAFDTHVHATAALGAPVVPTPVANKIPITTDPLWDSDTGSATVKVSE
jgi:hypothetical protein